MDTTQRASLILATGIFLGLAGTGWFISHGITGFREYERVVSVKGLSEREVPADLAVWPIQFNAASADLAALYATMDGNAKRISEFLTAKGFTPAEINIGAPGVTDKLAQQYGGNEYVQLRYTATQIVTVRSNKVDVVREAMRAIAELGKSGIAFAGQEFQQTEFIYTKLNEIKPAMVEEATRSAREVAGKFAQDSASTLGKIRSANQGQFSIENRDSSTPYIKKVRVVSTVDYYLSD